MQSRFTAIILVLLTITSFNLPVAAQEERTEAKEQRPPAFTIDYNYVFLNFLVQSQTPPPNVDISKLPPLPKDIYFQIHLLDLKYRHNFTKSISVTGLLPFRYMNMGLYPENAPPGFLNSYGLSDPSIQANYTLFPDRNNLIEFSAGVSFPLGSVNQRGKTPLKDDAYLPFPMQLGTGCFDILPGIFYRGFSDKLSWIFQAKADIKTSRNSLNYKFGNVYSGMGMVRYEWLDWFAQAIRLEARYTDKYEGNTRELTPGFIPDPSTQSLFNMDLVFNFSVSGKDSILRNSSFDVDFALPVVQVIGSYPKKMFGIRAGLHKGF
jgi:hypothetical protein